VFPNLFFHGGKPKIILISRETPAFENAYMPDKVDSGERSSITVKKMYLQRAATCISQLEL
jgi:hypothetical protein